MVRKRYSEVILGVLPETETGAEVVGLCRMHGMSEVTACNWGGQAGVTVSRLRPLKLLEATNGDYLLQTSEATSIDALLQEEALPADIH